MPTNGKQKGKAGERELARLFRDNGFRARRGQQFKGTPDSPDILCEELGWMHVECKRVESFQLYKSLNQAREDASEEQVPVVFHRKNKEEWVTVLRAQDFLNIIKLRNP